MSRATQLVRTVFQLLFLAVVQTSASKFVRMLTLLLELFLWAHARTHTHSRNTSAVIKCSKYIFK